MKLVICEKPSVGAAVAAALGVREKKDGYIEGKVGSLYYKHRRPTFFLRLSQRQGGFHIWNCNYSI